MSERNELRKYINESIALEEDFPIHLHPEITGEKVSPEELEDRIKKYKKAMDDHHKTYKDVPIEDQPMF